MDLPTHAAFGLAVGLVFFGQPAAAVLVLIGAILPDLDRDWLVKSNAIGEDQRHRAILHNVFIVGIAFLLSPFLAVGVFLHMLQDSFTTANDKGCEWFYPVSRWVKRGKFNEHKKAMKLDPKERIYFLQEDPENVASGPAIPWRRVYGPAQNSNIVDRLFLVSSLIVAGVWFGLKASVDLPSLVSAVTETGSNWVLFLALAVVLLAGLFFRNRRQIKFTRFARVGIVILGLGLALLWGFLVQTDLSANIKVIGSSWMPILLSGFLIVLSSYLVVEWHARKYKPAAVV
jgi:LPXTG-motif cell wall-anchored protein